MRRIKTHNLTAENADERRFKHWNRNRGPMKINNIVTSLEGMVESCKEDVKDKELEICRCRLMAIRQFLIASLKTYDEQGEQDDSRGK